MSKISLGLIIDKKEKQDEEFYQSLNEKVKTFSCLGFEKLYVCANEDVLSGIDFSLETVIKVVDTSERDNYQTKVNAISTASDDDYLTFVLDKDNVDDKFHNVILEYTELYGHEHKFFTPIIFRTTEKDELLDMINTIGWVSSLYEEFNLGHLPLSVIDKNLYENAPNLLFDGLVVHRDTFIESGMLKTNFEMAYSEEFFYRIFEMSHTVKSMNFLGYQSIFKNNNIDKSKLEKWIDLAKKEYHFVEEREITI